MPEIPRVYSSHFVAENLVAGLDQVEVEDLQVQGGEVKRENIERWWNMRLRSWESDGRGGYWLFELGGVWRYGWPVFAIVPPRDYRGRLEVGAGCSMSEAISTKRLMLITLNILLSQPENIKIQRDKGAIELGAEASRGRTDSVQALHFGKSLMPR